MSNTSSVPKTENIRFVASNSEDITLLAKGSGIVIAGSFIGGGLRYLFQLIVARHLGVESFGLFSLGLAIFSAAVVVASLGMSRGVLRFVSLYQGKGDHRRVKGTVNLAIGFSLVSSILVGLFLIGLSDVLATDVFQNTGLSGVLKLLALSIPFFAITAVFLSSTQALRKMRYKVYVRDLFELLSRIFLAILVFLLGWKLSGAIIAFVISIIGGTLLSFMYYRKVFHPIIGHVIRPIFETKKLLAFCWPILIANCFYLVVTWMPLFLLGYLATPRSVGVFSAAFTTSLLVQGIFIAFSISFSPYISDLHHRGENKKLESLFKIVAKWIFLLSFPIILLVIIFSREILTLFGHDFAVGAYALIILIIGQLVLALTGPLEVMIDMSGRSKIALLNAVIHFSLLTALAMLLIPRYNIIGAALTISITLGSLRFVRLLQVHYMFGIHPFRVGYVKPLIAGGAAWLVLNLGLRLISQVDDSVMLLVVGSLLFLTLYGITLYLLGFDAEDDLIFRTVRTIIT